MSDQGRDERMSVVTLLHLSDLHFGSPAVPVQVEALEAMIAVARYDVVAISGDVSQRARAGELQRAAVFLRDVRQVSRVICVPGNHDIAWWRSPMHVRGEATIYAPYRKYIATDLEPVLQLAGITLVGLNSSHGVHGGSLTWNPRDLSVIGDVGCAQLERVRGEFARAPDGDARVVVMHHNPMKGQLSRRFGVTRASGMLRAFADMKVDLVLCGHDHQEAVHFVEHTAHGTVVSTAGTLSDRSRGGRPSSVNAIVIRTREIEVTPCLWSPADLRFVPGPPQCFARSFAV